MFFIKAFIIIFILTLSPNSQKNQTPNKEIIRLSVFQKKSLD